jgi:hypothetical protein
MRIINALVAVFIILFSVASTQNPTPKDKLQPNPLINYNAFLENARRVQNLREERRISEADFIRMAAEPRTVIFDARSDSKFAMLHVKGAKHLSLPDFTADELARMLPDKSTRILIYCNNNFENEPKALPPKFPSTSLNLYTFNIIYAYGYRNVYELGPLIDIQKSILPFEGTLLAAGK